MNSRRVWLICGNPLKALTQIKHNSASLLGVLTRTSNLCCSTPSHLSERKSCLAQCFGCEAITPGESSYQPASVDFYLCTSLPFSHSLFLTPLFAPCMNPALPLLRICSATSLPLSLSLSPSPSSYVCLCPSVCLYTLTPSSLPSQHCSSWLPESQPPLSIPRSSHYHPLNEVRWRKIEIDKEETAGEKRAGENKRGRVREW